MFFTNGIKMVTYNDLKFFLTYLNFFFEKVQLSKELMEDSQPIRSSIKIKLCYLHFSFPLRDIFQTLLNITDAFKLLDFALFSLLSKKL